MIKFTSKIIVFHLISSEYLFSFEGTYIASKCTSSNCKGTGLSDLAESVIGGLFGQTPPIVN